MVSCRPYKESLNAEAHCYATITSPFSYHLAAPSGSRLESSDPSDLYLGAQVDAGADHEVCSKMTIPTVCNERQDASTGWLC
jgi:hypothetical protein